MKVSAPRLVVLVLVALVVALPPFLAEPGPGPSWSAQGSDGHGRLVAALAADHPVRILQHSGGALPTEAGAGDALFLFPGHRASSEAERARVLGFAERGGLVVLATDGEHGDAWLSAVGLKTQKVAALLAPGANASCVRAPAPLPDGTFGSLCLPSPTAFPDLESLQVSLPSAQSGNSTQQVFLDLDQDGELSLGDQGPQPFPMAVAVRRGDGWVVAVADGDLWRNHAVAPNLAYAEALAAGRGTVYVDSSADAGVFLDAWRRPLVAALAAPGLAEAGAFALLAASAALAVLRVQPAKAWLAQRTPDLREDPAREAAIAHAVGATRAAHPDIHSTDPSSIPDPRPNPIGREP